jgi:peptidyl-tRNA hydrolase, PTH1 family
VATTKLIVGLGNPGREYEKTRHNTGFMVVEALAQELGAAFKKCRYAPALTAEVREDGQRVLVALPQTFMNDSGRAVAAIVKFDNVAPEDILVVCDDLRLDIGQIRLRTSGSDAGHNGLKSVAAHLGTEEYTRLRVGIGAPAAEDMQKDFVLAVFDAAQKKMIGEVLERACDCCRLWLANDTARAMTLYNKRKNDEQV